MADRQKITHEQVIAAAEVLAVALADGMWRHLYEEVEVISRPVTEAGWLDTKAARKYVSFGETKFRALVKEGVLPKGVKVGGKLMWEKKALDRNMAKLFRKAKCSANGKRSSNQASQREADQRGTKPQKPR